MDTAIELSVLIREVSFSYRKISWDFTALPTGGLPNSAHIRITRGNTWEGPHNEVVADNLPGDTFYIFDDDVPPPAKRWERVVYRVEVIDRDTGNTLAQQAATAADIFPFGIVLADKHRNFLKSTHGKALYHLERKTQGIRCSACYHPIRRRIQSSDCEKCYGTAYEGGYNDPYLTNVGVILATEAIRKEIFAEIEPSQTRIWASNDPVIRSGDIFIEKDVNKRWQVVDINPRAYRGTLYRQDCLIDEIDPDESVFKLPAP